MPESKPMKWSELRERVAWMPDHADKTRLLAYIDAAAPAMKEQAEKARLYDLSMLFRTEVPDAERT